MSDVTEKRTDVPVSWRRTPDKWWEHVAACPACSHQSIRDLLAQVATQAEEIASLRDQRDVWEIRYHKLQHQDEVTLLKSQLVERAEAAEAEVERWRKVGELLEAECDRSNEGWRNGDYATVKIYVDREFFTAIATAALSPTNPSGAVASSERKDSDTKH